MRTRRVLAWLLVLLMIGGAGCLQGKTPASDDAGPEPARGPLEPLSDPIYALGEFLTLRIPSYDGTTLHVDLQLPEGDGPWPTVLEYTPYSILGDETWGAQRQAGQDASKSTADFYVTRGFAFGVAHVRGTGQSGGCLTVGGPEEGLDGAEIVQYITEQPWSNGKVGMRGASYVGTTPLETAIHNPPGLAAIAPTAAVTEWYKYYFENGEQRLLGGQSGGDSALWIGIGVIPGARTGTVDAMDAVCPAEMSAAQNSQDDYNEFWKARDHSAHAADILVPTLFVQGWDDTNVPPSMIPRSWGEIPAEKRAWFTQNGHGYPKASLRYMEYELRWFDHFLKDLDNGALDMPTVLIENDDGSVRAEDQWPPADVTTVRYWLADGALVTEAPSAGSASYTDTQDPAVMGVQPSGATDRPNVLQMSIDVPDGFVIAGDPILHLSAASDRTDTQFAGYLYGDGVEITRGHLDARHRDSLESGKDVVPGAREDYEWALRTIDDIVPNGTRLRLDVFSSDPDVQPDAGGQGATNTIYFGDDGSWIDIPVVPLRPTSKSIEDLVPALFP